MQKQLIFKETLKCFCIFCFMGKFFSVHGCVFILFLFNAVFALALSAEESKDVKTSVEQEIQTEKSKKTAIKQGLDFNVYIKKITESLPELQSNRIALLQAKNEVNRSKSTGDINLSAGAEAYRNNEYSGLSDNGNHKGYNVYGGLSKTVTSTGTDVALAYNYEKYSYSNFSNSSNYTAHNPSLTLKVTQPLLNNFLGMVSKYTEKNARMQYEIEKLQLVENNKTVINSYKKLYFQWVLYSEILEELTRAISNSKKLVGLTSRRYKAGLADNDDYQTARVSVYDYEVKYREYLNSLKAIENQLKLYLDVSKNKPLGSEFQAFYDRAHSSSFKDIDFSNTKSAEIIRKTLSNLRYSKSVYRNKLLPELNVYGQVAGENMSKEYDGTLKDRDYSVGFEFVYPLGNHSAESSLKDIELEIKSINQGYKETINTYKKNLWNYRSEFSTLKERIGLNVKTQSALKSQLATQRKKYRQARVTLSDVIETENSLTSSRIEYLTYKYNIISCYIDYSDLTDREGK